MRSLSAGRPQWRALPTACRAGVILACAAVGPILFAAAASGPRPSASWPGAELFVTGVVHRVRLEIRPEHLASLRRTPRKSVPATVRSAGRTYEAVAVHLKGSTGSFRPLDDKPGLTLDFGRSTRGQTFHGLSRVHLNNSVEDPSYVNETVAAELFRAAGLPAPRVAHALVELNDRSLGLYVLKEGFTTDFLGCYFAHVDGDLYDTDWGHDVDTRMRRLLGRGGEAGQPALDALAAATAEADLNRRWDRLRAVLDTDRFLAFMAAEVILCHRDGYCLARNNFRIYHDLDSGKLIFFPHGLDQLLGKPDLRWKPHFAGLVAAAMVETPEGRRAYRERFEIVFTNLFHSQSLTNQVRQLVQSLRSALARSEFAAVEREAGVVTERIRQREAELRRQLSQPESAPLKFVQGKGMLTAWTGVDMPPGGSLREVRDLGGRRVLHIRAGPVTSASWRTTAILPRGHYRFEGRVRVNDVQPLPFGRHQGASMRVAGTADPSGGLVGSSPWRQLRVEFEVVHPTEEVELVCELRAKAGEAWFDADSLCVVKGRP